MATAVQIVDRVAKELKLEHSVTAFDSDDVGVQAILALVNKAKNRILGRRDWSFDRRYGAMFSLMAKQTGVQLDVTKHSTAFTIADFDHTQNTEAAWGRCRLRIASDSDLGNTAIPVTDIDRLEGTVTSTTGVFETAFHGTTASTTSGSWELVQYEYPLPSTVKKVLAAWHEEQQLQIMFTDSSVVDPWPTPHLEAGNPELLVVGGTVTSTDVDNGGTTTGTRVAVLPPPSAQVTITYDYVYDHADFTATTDSLAGVPEEVVGLIVDQAVLFALQSRIKDDPQAARLLDVRLRADFDAIASRDDYAINRRRIPRPVGSFARDTTWRRWANRQVPTP